ncbi:MAG: cobalamin B12-binding domain-containing protein [candidate division WOR-3 bacterium]
MPWVLGAALGNDVHVAGLVNFLLVARGQGYQIRFIGPAVSPQELIDQVRQMLPDLVAVSYRLTPRSAGELLEQLRVLRKRKLPTSVRFVFGGTPETARVARACGLFDQVFDGTEPQDAVQEFLTGRTTSRTESKPANALVPRIEHTYPRPLLRHHFGRPSVAETVAGARAIATSGVLDVLSLGPDQNAQASFFRPTEIDSAQDGAGGVPLRREEDLTAIYEATRTGNYPLVRCYAGTRDLVRWAEMLHRTVNVAWGAVPLFWYSQLDGRSDRPLPEAIAENQRAIRWYAEHGIPVEVNEAHQWSLRDAHDALGVAAAFLAAYNAKRLGVRHYIAQYMFNTPSGTSAAMDLAKMLAKIELIEGLQDAEFRVYRQVRAGLAHFVSDLDQAKGQLAASAVVSLALRPHILHVVGFCEADHLVTAPELIESCRIVLGVLRDVGTGLPDMTQDQAVQTRKTELIHSAQTLVQAIQDLNVDAPDALTDPAVLTRAVQVGLLDAPHLANNRYARGRITTGLVRGCCEALDPVRLEPISESERIRKL